MFDMVDFWTTNNNYPLIFIPIKIAIRQTSKLIAMFSKAYAVCPVSRREKVSREKVEKVEKPPQNPVIHKSLVLSVSPDFRATPNKYPKIIQLMILASSVAKGKLNSFPTTILLIA